MKKNRLFISLVLLSLVWVGHAEGVNIDHAKANAHNDQGVTYFWDRLYDHAAEEFRMAIEMNPYFSKARFNLGVTYFYLGKLHSAFEEYRHLKRLHPETARQLLRVLSRTNT